MPSASIKGIRARRLLLEYDDERSGSFAPLKRIPEDKVVVLGLVSTKTPHLEKIQDLEARIREASQFFPLEQLALSPQCGFASSIIGNNLTELEQFEKLRLVCATASRIWPAN